MELLAREQNAVPDGMAGADSGQRIHGELHEPESQDLALSESDMAERCERQRQEVINDWLADHFGRDDVGEIYEFKETRLGLTPLGTVITVPPETKVKVVFSGQFDGAEIDIGQAGIIWDFKTLLGNHETAQTNLQLLSLAWLAAKRWSLDRVRVALIQPWKGEPTVADYDKGALKDAGNFIERTIHLITQPAVIGATNPGPQCRFCPGRLVCPAEAWTALAPLLNFKQEAFLAACKPSPPALEEQIRIASGPKITAAGKPHKTQMALSGLEAKKTLETALGSLITKKTSKRLTKIGAQLEDENNE
jgi:hypothetical protein